MGLTWIENMARKLGVVILHTHLLKDGTYIILARRDLSRGPEWITWGAKLDHKNKEADFYWGHYFNDFTAAEKDYHKRYQDIEEFWK